MSGCRSVACRLFHSFGPATEKLLSARQVLVRGTVRALASAERRQRRPESAVSWQSVISEVRWRFATQRLEDQKSQLESTRFFTSANVTKLVRCGHVASCQSAVELPHSGSTADTGKGCPWYRKAAHCSSQDDRIQTPAGLRSWPRLQEVLWPPELVITRATERSDVIGHC